MATFAPPMTAFPQHIHADLNKATLQRPQGIHQGSKTGVSPMEAVSSPVPCEGLSLEWNFIQKGKLRFFFLLLFPFFICKSFFLFGGGVRSRFH